MASKSNIIVGLDIGTTNITVVVADLSSNDKPQIIGVGSNPSRGLRKGVVINIEATVESIARAVEQAETMAGCEVGTVYASISGAHVKGFNSNGIVGVRSKEVSAFDIEKVIEAAKAVAIPLDREVLHVLPQEFIIDDQDGIKEPLGISGVRLEARVHIVTGSVASAQNVVKCANRCGLNVRDIVLSSVASGRAVLSVEEMELGVCVVDIGGGTTDITVFHKGAVKHTSVIPVAGTHLTNDIAAGLRTPIAAAESIKCRHGSAMIRLASGDETLEVPSTGGRPPRVLSRSVLAEIIEPRVAEILSLVQRELVRADCDELLTSGLVLTGGTANLRGLVEMTEHTFNLPVRLGVPTQLGGLTDLVNSPEYSTAAGLILYGSSHEFQSRLGSNGSGFRRTFRRVANWFGEHF